MARLAQAVRIAGELTRGLVDATLLEPIGPTGYASDLADVARARAALRSPRPAGRGRIDPPAVAAGPAGSPAGAPSRAPPGSCSTAAASRRGSSPTCSPRSCSSATRASRSTARATCASAATASPARSTSQARSTGAPCTVRARAHRGRHERHRQASWLSEAGAPRTICSTPPPAPAFTGIAQVTALAPNALMAEVRAKAALLSGPSERRGSLPHGGVIVLDDGSHQVIEHQQSISIRRNELGAPVLSVTG